MLASWYDQQGPAADVLQYGELPDPTPGPGEVRVHVTVSAANPGDTKKRSGWTGSAMPYPQVIPHSDAAGTVDARRVGQRVWVYGAQSYRPFGTAAQYTVAPGDLAVPLPDHLTDDLGASLGIPGITAHRTVFADGPVDGELVLVNGVLGGVGSLAAQLARWGGATVIGTVRRGTDLDRIDPAVVSHAVALDCGDPAGAIRAHAPEGVDRIIEVALSDNAELDDAVAANGAVIAAYATRDDRTEIPFWTLLFNNVTLRLLGSDDFPVQARRQAARDLTAAAAVGALSVDVGDRFPLADIAKAHDRVDAGGRGRVLIDVPR
ncbi:NADPH:quinone reductase [Streptomyces turgidiscabies]|uniref:Oxidoreductase, zinc-binding dehydrogenase family protein n=1 Tax=Streptomyces turgidiscabies (strain Car8) TaxID=698760 RepID=L7EYJ4_STRT8|nr:MULTISPECIES: NADPH:quinone reductase [Streptomyces]ELP63786.1 oxidoreductase, zinc-binding dehydrogenase family protein [Streptomyces turgidiscabies Car8]MDX3491744.1 NADPH:quinone reductase [Streptomyces turgidiscabies]GAQ72140.1 zinc-type alcohol dehydrogenase-like protein [Streptomyces turgidiscabies]